MSTILLRLNLDIKDKSLGNNLRFNVAASSIKSLSNKSNKIVILSHFGRPKGIDKKLSLRKFKTPLEKKIGRNISFISNFDFKKIKEEIDQARGGSIFLLENLRFLPGEIKNSRKLSKDLASLGTKFINNDFATSHRTNSSNVGITNFIKSSPSSFLKKEISNLSKILKNPKKPFVLVIGGAKMKDKIGVINNLLPKVDYVLLGGGAANTFLVANGENIGNSIYDKDLLKVASKISRSRKIFTPSDHKKEKGKILDIGPETLKQYREIIKKAKTIVWGGPMGYFEKKEFAHGSYEIAKAIADSKAYSVVGGAETSEIISNLNLENKISFISTGGGAMLNFLAGKKLPALKALGL